MNPRTTVTLPPVTEAHILLARVESLVVHALRWDDETRVELAELVGHLYDATTAYDPQHLVQPIEVDAPGRR